MAGSGCAVQTGVAAVLQPGDGMDPRTMSDFDEFKSYYALANQLIESMPKEQLADCLRLLAVYVAEYRSQFGEMPRQDLLELLDATEINHSQARLLRDGMGLLVGHLASVRCGLDDEYARIH